MTQNALGRQMAMLPGRLVGDAWEIPTIEQSLDPLALHTGPPGMGSWQPLSSHLSPQSALHATFFPLHTQTSVSL